MQVLDIVMVKKKSNLFRNIILVLTIVFFVAGIILIGMQVVDYFQEKSIDEKVSSAELSSGGIVSINIVEASVENQE